MKKKSKEYKSSLLLAERTVKLFSEILETPLVFKPFAGKSSCTNQTVYADPDDEWFYTAVEHELAHIVFKSNLEYRNVGLQHLRDMVVRSAGSKGPRINWLALHEMMGDIYDILEDYRVESLWGYLYEGSYVKMQERALGFIPFVERETIPTVLLSLASDVRDIPSQYAGIEGLLDNALKQVFRASEGATLQALGALVDALLDYCVDPPQTLQDGAQELSKEATLYEESKPSLPHLKGSRTTQPMAPEEHAAARQSTRGTDERDFKREAEEQLRAIQTKLLMREQPKLSDYPRVAIITTPMEFKEDRYFPSSTDQKVIRDIQTKVRRLYGRPAMELDYSGSSIDMEEYLQYRVTKKSRPWFADETKRKGSSVRVLVDLSASVSEFVGTLVRTVSLLTESFASPYVDLKVLGFNSIRVDECTIYPWTKFKLYPQEKFVGGNTPTHVALSYAKRDLQKSRYEEKFIFLLTDGMPVFNHTSAVKVQSAAKTALYNKETRAQVDSILASRISLATLLISEDIGDKEAANVFGPAWIRCTPESLPNLAIQLAATSVLR